MPLLKSSSSPVRRTTSSDKQLDTAARTRPFQGSHNLSTLFPFRITAIRPRWFFARSLLPLPSLRATFRNGYGSFCCRQRCQPSYRCSAAPLARSVGRSVSRPLVRLNVLQSRTPLDDPEKREAEFAQSRKRGRERREIEATPSLVVSVVVVVVFIGDRHTRGSTFAFPHSPSSVFVGCGEALSVLPSSLNQISVSSFARPFYSSPSPPKGFIHLGESCAGRLQPA